MEEAQAKFDLACKHADIIGGLAQFSGYTGFDISHYPLDEELKLDTSDPKEGMVQGFLGNFVDSLETEPKPWTPRRLGYKMALGGLHPSPIGTPEMIADIMQDVRCGFFLSFITAYTRERNRLTIRNSGSRKQMSMALISPTRAASKMWSICSFRC